MFYKNLPTKLNKWYLSFTIKKDHQYIAFFRIAVGIIALLDLFSMRDGFKLFFSNNDVIVPQKLQYLFTEYFDYLNEIYSFLEKNNLVNFFYKSVIISYVIFLLLLVFGLMSRFSSIMAIIFQLIIFKSIAIYNFGYDHFLTMSLFYCILFPVGKVYSVDNLLFRKNKEIVLEFDYSRIIQFHLTLVYVFSGLAKIVSKTWWNGEAMWRAVSSVYDDYFKIPAIILAVVGIITIITETFYPLFIKFHWTKKITIYSMISMHFFIAFILELPYFAAIMIVWNITSYFECFYKPKKLYV
jgi:hypothetical protein